MTNHFRDRFRISSARAPFWDYGSNAAYFVTICTHGRVCWFGDVSQGQMIFSEIGKIVQSEWLKTFNMRPDMNLIKGEFVIMPNHFHGIIVIGENSFNSDDELNLGKDAMHCVSTNNTKADINLPKNKFGPQSKNLASIIRGFKAGVTKGARQIHPDFRWQPRYFDRIIRDEQSYRTISNYIINNSLNWATDQLFHGE